jgi:cytochrome c-type biogenesis protein CcmH
VSARAAAALLLLVAWVGLAAGARAAEDPEREVRDIAAALRCPVCQSLSVADSPSELAQQMRELIRRKVAAGERRGQIVDYFVARYGEDVLLDPPRRGFTLLLWLGPLLALAAAAALLTRSLTRWRRGREELTDGLEAGRS